MNAGVGEGREWRGCGKGWDHNTQRGRGVDICNQLGGKFRLGYSETL